MTEKMNGSSRMTTLTDSPWWIVRPALAAALACSVAITASAFHFVGLPGVGRAFAARPRGEWMQLLGTTPILIGFATCAFAILLRRSSTGSLRMLCAVLAFASLAGAWNGASRDSHGRGPIERWAENSLADAPAVAACCCAIRA